MRTAEERNESTHQKRQEKTLWQMFLEWLDGIFSPKLPEQEGGTSATESGEEARVPSQPDVESKPATTTTESKVPKLAQTTDFEDPRTRGGEW